MFDIKKEKWEESYKRNENFIYFPKEESVKFLNRFIKKKISLMEYVDLLESKQKLKALDFGCGIGRMTVLLHEFDIEGYGIDISQTAINEAKKFARHFNFDLKNNFQAYNGENIPFEDNYFDFTISEAVLDSLPFELAKKLIKEIERVTKRYFFLSLISSESAASFSTLKESGKFNGEIEVDEAHEQGTIQSFFDKEKIAEFIKDTQFKIKWCELHTTQECNDTYAHSRYYIVLEK